MEKYFYSPSTGGFFIDVIHREIPGDAVEITAEQHQKLLLEQSEGKTIVFDEGEVKTIEPVAILTWESIRVRRDAKLTSSDWTQIPDSPLSEEIKAAWREYRTLLRDITDNFDSPDEVVWPSEPEGK